MTHTDRILRLLADGRPRSSGEIAEWLDITRDAVHGTLTYLKGNRRIVRQQDRHNGAVSYTLPKPKPPRQLAREPKDTEPEIPWKGNTGILAMMEVRG